MNLGGGCGETLWILNWYVALDLLANKNVIIWILITIESWCFYIAKFLLMNYHYHSGNRHFKNVCSVPFSSFFFGFVFAHFFNREENYAWAELISCIISIHICGTMDLELEYVGKWIYPAIFIRLSLRNMIFEDFLYIILNYVPGQSTWCGLKIFFLPAFQVSVGANLNNAFNSFLFDPFP